VAPPLARSPCWRVIDPEQLLPANHQIRRIRPLVEAVLVDLGPTFERMYAEIGRPSIPPEHLLKSCLRAMGATADSHPAGRPDQDGPSRQ